MVRVESIKDSEIVFVVNGETVYQWKCHVTMPDGETRDVLGQIPWRMYNTLVIEAWGTVTDYVEVYVQRMVRKVDPPGYIYRIPDDRKALEELREMLSNPNRTVSPDSHRL